MPRRPRRGRLRYRRVVRSTDRFVRRAISAVVALALIAACAADGPGAAVEGVEVGDGFDVEVLVDGLVGPTQIDMADDRLIVAELNGSEGGGTGRVLSVDLDDPTDREVVVEGLTTPTGVAVDGGLLWVMEQRRLTVGPIDDPGDRTVVLDELPFNGRSEGTLTAVEGGGILYDTSGSRDASAPSVLEAGSGSLWFLASPDAEPEQFATGFKHAYAHVRSPAGELFVTEISDGQLDGASPPDELMVVEMGNDFGYPRCIGDGVPVVELGATDDTCASTPRSHAVFPPRSTPTSVAIAPWDPDTVLVSLWNDGVIVSVPADVPETVPHRGAPFMTGLTHPQHLLADGDRLLVVDFDGGRVLTVVRT